MFVYGKNVCNLSGGGNPPSPFVDMFDMYDDFLCVVPNPNVCVPGGYHWRVDEPHYKPDIYTIRIVGTTGREGLIIIFCILLGQLVGKG